jgi:YidC/Oxa1 family membrane protein insertase
MNKSNQGEPKVFLATLLSVLFLLFWSFFFNEPTKNSKENIKDTPLIEEAEAKEIINKSEDLMSFSQRSEALEKTKDDRVFFENNKIYGSVNLTGGRVDDISLKKYKKELDSQENVNIFSPASSKERYFSDFGWISSGSNEVPNPQTKWNILNSNDNEILISWISEENIEFQISYTLDENYLIKVNQRVINNSKKDINITPYSRISKMIKDIPKSNFILHEGPMVVSNGILSEFDYSELSEENEELKFEYDSGWVGIADKYWLTSIISNEKSTSYIDYELKNKHHYFNLDKIGQNQIIKKNNSLNSENLLFVGAKELDILDQYSENYNIDLFDRSVDFGWYYFLTKPFYFILKFFSIMLGNYGLAILAMTVIVKLLLFPIANKSYAAMAKIKTLQPEIDKIRGRYKDDKVNLNKAIMDLYRSKKVNPASGCLPMLIQIPVFFALYKVLFITIDMRHAPFYGWIKDLSIADPTSIFNLFGLLPFEVGGIFAIGVWPILMGLSMLVQQKLNPPISDPVQAKVMKLLPIILIFVFATFPAGLLIYWTWNNILSIIQQYLITKRFSTDKK